MATSPKPITPKQARFVAEYLKDLNGKQAAIRAGYTATHAEVTASHLLSNPKVKAEVSKKRDTQMQGLDFDARRVLQELARLASFDIRSMFNPDGSVKAVTEWTAEQGAAVSSAEVVIKNAAAGDGVVDRVLKFRLWDKTRALEALAKHFALLTERVDLDGEIVIRHELSSD